MFWKPYFKYNWIILKLEGVESNRSAIGTRLKLDLENGRSIYYSINTGGSFGANSLQAEIGIGSSKLIDTLTIRWPNSKAQIFKRIEGNKKYKLVEGGNKLIEEPYQKIQLMGRETMHNHN